MADINKEYPSLSNLMLAHLNPDWDMEANSIPEVIANYARIATQARRDQLFRDIDAFIKRFRDNLNAAFVEWWELHIETARPPKTALEFFDMIRAIVTDPECYKQYEDSGNVQPPPD